ARDAAGNVYVADSRANRVRRVAADTGLVSTVAGNGRVGAAAAGIAATGATLNGPEGLAFDREGRLLIADTGNHRIRRLELDGTVTTVAGSGRVGLTIEGAQAEGVSIGDPRGIAVDERGRLLLWHDSFVERVDEDGALRTLVGRNGLGPLLAEGA